MKTQIFSNSATSALFDNITHEQLTPLKQTLKKEDFSDGEIVMKYPNSIRGNDIFIMGDTSHNLPELLFSIDAAKRASVKSITVVLPYYGYGRQDRKGSERASIGAKVMATVLEGFKVDRLVTIDLHAAQIEGFFNIPVDHIKGHTIFLDTLKQKFTEAENIEPWFRPKYIICSPDEGGVKRAGSFASRLGVPLVTIKKERSAANSIDTMELIGDVKDCDVWIVDDMADTCGTLCKAASLLIEKGATKVSAIATHAVLSGKAYQNLKNSNDLSELIISDTVVTPDWVKNTDSKIKIVSCMGVLQKAIAGIINEESLQELTN